MNVWFAVIVLISALFYHRYFCLVFHDKRMARWDKGYADAESGMIQPKCSDRYYMIGWRCRLTLYSGLVQHGASKGSVR